MNFSALARIPFQAVLAVCDALVESDQKRQARMLSRMYPDMDALNEIEGEIEAHEPDAPYLSWGTQPMWSCAHCGKESTAECAAKARTAPGLFCSAVCADAADGVSYCIRCGYPHSTETQCLRDKPEPELMAFGVASVLKWIQENRRTDVRIQCGHCLKSVGGFKDFAKHMLTCTLTPDSPGESSPDEVKPGSISFKSYDSMSSPGVPPPGASPGGEVESRPETTAPSSPGVDPSGANGSIPPGAVPGEGPSDSAIPPAPEGHPNLAELIAEVLAEHEPWGSISGFVNCYNPSVIETPHAHCNDKAAWREHVSVNIANRILLRTPPGALTVWEAR